VNEGQARETDLPLSEVTFAQARRAQCYPTTAVGENCPPFRSASILLRIESACAVAARASTLL